MASQNHLSIIEAVETLSNIADLDFDHDIGVAHKHEIVLASEKIAYKTVHWLHPEDASGTVNLVKETFRVILHYLKSFYKNEYAKVNDQQTLDGIKTIMVLVGEAAKKLDHYVQNFHQTEFVTEFKEYRQLQEFYQTKIAHKLDEDVLSKWVLGLALAKTAQNQALTVPVIAPKKLMDSRHVFIDLETVKKDTEYELFFIRKEDGSRFFSPRLLRNIKLVSDFGSYFGERKERDPLEHVKEWMDLVLYNCGKELLRSLGQRLDKFFRETRKSKEHDLIAPLNKALLALLMSGQSQNLLRHRPIKSCTEYFEDFQGFFREAMLSRTFQRWEAYPPKESNRSANELLDLIETLCRSLYVNLRGLDEMKAILQGFMPQGQTAARESKLWKVLADDYSALVKLLKHRPNGPLRKVVELLEENSTQNFDPLRQHNLPSQLYYLYVADQRYAFLRIPAPIIQEVIHKATINDVFRAWIRSNNGSIERKHLLFNLQDRTSWREHSRSIALEELQQQPLMKGLTVVTLAVDTDFYHQLSPYHEIGHADEFMTLFKELLLDKHAGYFFPSVINNEELSQFIDQAFQVMHQLFFSSKNVLSRESRLNFIEIFYWFLQLKITEWIRPDTISFTCKDAIDTGEASSAALLAFLKLIHSEEWSDGDRKHLNWILHAPALLLRERAMLPERFNRMLSAIKVVEGTNDAIGKLEPLFKTPILRPQIHLGK